MTKMLDIVVPTVCYPMSSNSSLKVLLIDDEKKACINLSNMLKEYVDPDINILGFAHNTTQAETCIRELKPDAVFLDIEMPNENAFSFLSRISPISFDVIFVTAYDEYAVKAFRFNAIDYILKPISIGELTTAVVKLKERIAFKQSNIGEQMSFAELEKDIVSKNKLGKITLKDASSVEVVNIKDLCFIEAQGSYSRIVFIKESKIKEIVLSAPLSDYEELLPADIFYRVHRSYLVNCTQITQIVNSDSPHVLVHSTLEIPVSRRRYSSFLDFLSENNMEV